MEQMLGMSIRMPAASNADLLAGINYRINDALAPYRGGLWAMVIWILL
jgi:hypothetical protein